MADRIRKQTRALTLALVGAGGLLLSACSTLGSTDRLAGFASDEDFIAFVNGEPGEAEDGSSGVPEPVYGSAPPPPSPPPPPPPPPPLPGAVDDEVLTVTASRISSPANESITNTQVVGVDEGGIVKNAGDYLIVLRRGRLFTLSTANGAIEAVDRIDAFPPGMEDPDGWYDEMLIEGSTIIVIGFNYQFDATEISRFGISDAGELSYVDTHYLRSEDYYSSRNYASRLIGETLVFYTPLPEYNWRAETPLDLLPGMAVWDGESDELVYERLAGVEDVYLPQSVKEDGFGRVDALHTVTRCDLSDGGFDCSATVVMGPSGRTFYVSREAVYVWVGQRWRASGQNMVYRIPLDGTEPGAAQVRGMPVDQFSFHEEADRLNVLVAPSGGGDWMWSPEFSSGQPALLQLPMARFGGGADEALTEDYRLLPTVGRRGVDRNRYVGDWLFFTVGDADGTLTAVPLDGGPVEAFELGGRVSRIEVMGRDAVAVGQDEGLLFSTIDLSGAVPSLYSQVTLEGLEETESRSQAFFYRPDPDSADLREGLLGLPVMTWDDSYQDGADMVFLRRTEGALERFGRLQSRLTRSGSRDGCLVSCVDWYGNARPIFLRDRIFALLGYELVEGEAGDKRIEEIGRVDFRPPPRPAVPAVAAPGP
ncbi:MAG: hypothetical protein CMF75_02470 [Maricaulis sp.]|nr:hypothetical protein [Maricaulis sp.]